MTMMAKVLLWSYGGLIAFSLLGSALSKLLAVDSAGIEVFASLALLITGACYVGMAIGDWRTCVGVLLASGAIEAIGVTTGLPFGSYHYTESWAPLVPLPGGHLFPLALPLAWLLVAGSSWVVMGRWLKGIPRVIASGFLTMLIDIPLEDVMTKGLGYWQWAEPGPLFGAPLMNSVGWLVTGTFCAFLFSLSRQGEAKENHVGLVFAAYCLLMGEMALLHALSSLPLWILLILGFSLAGRIPSHRPIQEQTA